MTLPSANPFGIARDIWPRVSTLFDELIDCDESVRNRRLNEIRVESPEIVAALAKLLANASFANQKTASARALSSPFASALEVALADHARMHAAGEHFGPWTLTERIGRGGMGEVWRAKRNDGLYDADAAIKLLRTDLSAQRLALRFERERQTLARLNHPNIARLLDAGVADDCAYLVLEMVDGLPLIDYVEKHAPKLADRVRVIRDLTRAVEYAHAQLVLHRDLKPSNVIVTRNGHVKLLDFGIAAALDRDEQSGHTSSLTQLTGRGLTVEYAAPEQIMGEPTVAASDVYSLGAMLYQLCVGTRPFADKHGRSAAEYAVVHDEPERASVAASRANDNTHGGERLLPPSDRVALRGDLDAIIAKSLRKSPEDRYATATAFATDLDAWLHQEPISIRASDRAYRTQMWFKRNWKLAALGGVAATAICASLAVSLWQRNLALEAAQLASDEAARATKVADYMGELIQSASPDNHGGKWPTVIALLEQAEKDFDKSFNDDLKTKALLLQYLADTNNVLNRDTVSLVQYEKLLAIFDAMGETKSERAIDSRYHYAAILKRVNRDELAAREYERLEPLMRAHYGAQSKEYSNVLAYLAIERARTGRTDEARALLERSQAIMRALFPGDQRKRMDGINDAAVMLTRAGLWREAEQTLSKNEPDLAKLATLGGSSARDALLQRNNLEAIRIRIGKLEGTDERLRRNGERAKQLLGGDNPISYRSEELRANVAFAQGRFADAYSLLQARIAANANRKGLGNDVRLEDELLRIRSLALHSELATRVDAAAVGNLRRDLRRALDTIAKDMKEPSEDRAYLYRNAADAAIAFQAFDLATEAIAKAQADLKTVGVRRERMAQTERAAAALAYAEGDVARAVSLLKPRFDLFISTHEGDSPLHATLWLQQALFLSSVDRDAATHSLNTARSMFQRLGSTPPHLAAYLEYVDARVANEPQRAQAKQLKLDQAYVRRSRVPWRPPHLPSV
jgi:eukaryotic-like serine/threonine-protein kinase